MKIKGFTITFGSDKFSVEGPNEEACSDIGQAFLALLKSDGGPELVAQYIDAHEKLTDVLDIPSVAEDYPALENLANWLRENPAFVRSVEDALESHGYHKIES